MRTFLVAKQILASAEAARMCQELKIDRSNLLFSNYDVLSLFMTKIPVKQMLGCLSSPPMSANGVLSPSSKNARTLSNSTEEEKRIIKETMEEEESVHVVADCTEQAFVINVTSRDKWVDRMYCLWRIIDSQKRRKSASIVIETGNISNLDIS